MEKLQVNVGSTSNIFLGAVLVALRTGRGGYVSSIYEHVRAKDKQLHCQELRTSLPLNSYLVDSTEGNWGTPYKGLPSSPKCLKLSLVTSPPSSFQAVQTHGTISGRGEARSDAAVTTMQPMIVHSALHGRQSQWSIIVLSTD